MGNCNDNNCLFGCGKKHGFRVVQPARSETISSVVHFYTGDPSLRCNIELSDGRTHKITSEIEDVSCGDCKIIYLAEQNRKLNEDLAEKREELRVSKQAYTFQHQVLTDLRRRCEEDQQQIRRMRVEIDYLKGHRDIYYVDPHTGRTVRRY